MSALSIECDRLNRLIAETMCEDKKASLRSVLEALKLANSMYLLEMAAVELRWKQTMATLISQSDDVLRE